MIHDVARPASDPDGRLQFETLISNTSAALMIASTPITFPEDESFDIGRDTRTGVAMLEHRYDSPFPFTETIDKLTFDLNPAATVAARR